MGLNSQPSAGFHFLSRGFQPPAVAATSRRPGHAPVRPADLSDDDLLARLLALNLERSAQGVVDAEADEGDED
jgi:hypothetical protein